MNIEQECKSPISASHSAICAIDYHAHTPILCVISFTLRLESDEITKTQVIPIMTKYCKFGESIGIGPRKCMKHHENMNVLDIYLLAGARTDATAVTDLTSTSAACTIVFVREAGRWVGFAVCRKKM